MTYYFLDRSALVKRYVDETGSEWVRSISDPSSGNTVVIAGITRVEATSGAMRRMRDGSITARTAHAVRLLVDRHASRQYKVVGLTEQVTRRAGDLLERHPLRAYDSVQLASALESHQRLVAARLTAITFVSADTRLLAIASAEGLATDDPNAHP